MLWYEYLMNYIGILICHLVMLDCYRMITKDKIKIDKKSVLSLIIIPVFSLINNIYNYNFPRVIVHFLLICLTNKLVSRDGNRKVMYFTLPVYLLMMFFELIIGGSLSLLNFSSIEELEQKQIVRVLLSTLIILLTLLLCKFKKIQKLLGRISKFLSERNDKISLIICSCLIVFLSYSTYKNIYNYGSIKAYLLNCVPLIIFIVTLVVLIIQMINVKKAEEKQETLLEFIQKYESMIDKDRINRHEMLNNLLVLKSFKDKNNKEYDKVLNNFIKTYKNTGDSNLKNLYNLPSGLKGIIYFKVNDINKLNIKLNTHISSACVKYLDNLDSKLYVKITKIIGILIDNAIEASKESDEKLLSIDIYKEKERIVFEISNTTKNEVNIELINKQNYSSKGKGRGLGLYLVNIIVKSTYNLNLKQLSNKNIFTTILELDVKK